MILKNDVRLSGSQPQPPKIPQTQNRQKTMRLWGKIGQKKYHRLDTCITHNLKVKVSGIRLDCVVRSATAACAGTNIKHSLRENHLSVLGNKAIAAIRSQNMEKEFELQRKVQHVKIHWLFVTER